MIEYSASEDKDSIDFLDTVASKYTILEQWTSFYNLSLARSKLSRFDQAYWASTSHEMKQHWNFLKQKWLYVVPLFR